MKRILLIIPLLLLLLWSTSAFSGGPGLLFTASCTPTETPETSCSDTIDNDCDGFTDGDDSDCGAAGTWNYPSGISDNNDNAITDSGYAHSSYVYGNVVQAGASGTVTQISVKLYPTTSGTIKIGLYSNANSLLSQGSTSVTTAMQDTWVSIPVNVSVTSGTSYRIFYSASVDTVGMAVVQGVTGWYGTCAYASAMCDPPTSVASESTGYTVRMCVGGTCE